MVKCPIIYVFGMFSFGFSGHDQEVGGDQSGEGFGQTALACDINGKLLFFR